jgi:hypothetical protein
MAERADDDAGHVARRGAYRLCLPRHHPLTARWERTLRWVLTHVVDIGPTRPQWRVVLLTWRHRAFVAKCNCNGKEFLVTRDAHYVAPLWRIVTLVHVCCLFPDPSRRGIAWGQAMIRAAERCGRAGYGAVEMAIRQDQWMHLARSPEMRHCAVDLIQKVFDPDQGIYEQAHATDLIDLMHAHEARIDPAESWMWRDLIQAVRQRLSEPPERFAR